MDHSFDDFVKQIGSFEATGPELAANVLHAINRYFYQRDPTVDGFSGFEAYWRANHADILALTINEKACKDLADLFHRLWSTGGFVHLKENVDVSEVSPRIVANVRFFTAVQDFKVDISKNNRNPYRDPESVLFDAEQIATDESTPFRILRYLGAEGSQTDKRVEWMREQARFLRERYDGEAYAIAARHQNDAIAIKEELVAETGMGFKEKKADMFLRDMTELGVWSYDSGVDTINVASDANTMRVALRSGIITGRLPLVSSFLDVYCYQYKLLDSLTQRAWRTVWNQWGISHPNTQPKTPASMDYMIYKGIGKTYCTKTAKCLRGLPCPLNDHCPRETRRLQPPKSISIHGMTGWNSASSDDGGGLGLSS